MIVPVLMTSSPRPCEAWLRHDGRDLSKLIVKRSCDAMQRPCRIPGQAGDDEILNIQVARHIWSGCRSAPKEPFATWTENRQGPVAQWATEGLRRIVRARMPRSGGHPKRQKYGRSGEIRTPDPLLPKQVRYQAALRSARPMQKARKRVQAVAKPRSIADRPLACK